jgi:putative ABC transport system permease protein
MFDLDKWQEIFATLKKNKLRTFLTSFSVAWGIFLLIILLGSGSGIQNAVMLNFQDNAKNAVWISGRTTSMEHKGLNKGRDVQLTNFDYEIIKNQVEHVDNISPQFNIWGGTKITYKNESGNFSVQCVLPSHQPIEGSEIVSGRYLNQIDITKRRKVAVVGVEVKKIMFKDLNPVGEFIQVNGIPFKVVGVYEDGNRWQDRRVVLPFSAAQQIFNGGVNVSTIGLTTGDASVEESMAMEEEIRQRLSRIHAFNPNDHAALNIYNTLKDYKQTQKVFFGIKVFLWFIGLGTLIAGIVGVGNIMLIVVKERTREIGVRKALGATPYSVVSLIISEAVLITTLAGYIGMVLGVGLMELIDFFIDQSIANAPETTDAAGQQIIFLNPTVNIGVAIGATLVLIISGSFAGLIPAIRASKIKPIEALRYE